MPNVFLYKKGTPPKRTSRRCLLISTLILIVSTTCAIACIPYNSDNILVGQLCHGEPECEQSIGIVRHGVGRTRIDFTIKNNSAQDETINVEIAVPKDASSSTPTEILAVRTYILKPGESAGERFTANEIGTRRDVDLVVDCGNCDFLLDYVVGIEPLECRKTSECSNSWICAENRGICVQCVKNSDCKPEQVCAPNGLCLPADQGSSCSTMANHAADANDVATPFIILVVLLIVVRSTRRRSQRRSHDTYEEPLHRRGR